MTAASKARPKHRAVKRDNLKQLASFNANKGRFFI